MGSPLPNPVINRAAMSCPRLYEEHWRAAPTTMIEDPMKIVRFLPRILPSQIVATAPKKHPRVYPPTVMPCTFEAWLAVTPGGGVTVLICGNNLHTVLSLDRLLTEN